MAKIYSMASNDVVIAVYKKGNDKSVGAKQIKQAIIIKGGANVRDHVTGQNKNFVETVVTPEELKLLQANSTFNRKVKAGFLTVDKKPEVFKADKSAQITEKEMKAKAPKAEVKTGLADAE